MATFATGSLSIPKQKLDPWLGKIRNGSVVATLSTPTPMTYGEGESWTFDIGEAEYLAVASLQADALVTDDPELIAPQAIISSSALSRAARIDELRRP